MITKNVLFKICIGILIFFIFIFYFKTFFTKGANFYGIFLKKETLSSESHYVGKSKKGSIEITVRGQMKNQGSVDVIYKLPNRSEQQFTVNFNDIGDSQATIQDIKDKAGKVVFPGGTYSRQSHFLISKDGQPEFDTEILVNGESPFNTDITIYPETDVSISNAVSFAASENDTIRGKYQYFVPAVFLLLFTLIDIKFPLFFFSLRHFLDVKDPEPSELYISMQRISWRVYPVIIIILMIISI